MDRVLVLDFGSQYNQLIARRVRELKVYSEIVACDITADEVRRRNPQALILSGGPASVLERGAPMPDPAIFKLGIPILGICYGMQATTRALGGRVAGGSSREYGRAQLRPGGSRLLAGVPRSTQAWMSHGDHVARLPRGFKSVGRTAGIANAAMADEDRLIYGVQFHPEVEHTPEGRKILANFVLGIAGARPTWTMQNFIREKIEQVRERVGTGRVICAVSGGVDSSVMAALLARAVGKRLLAVFVDNGLLRHEEEMTVSRTLGRRMTLKTVDARKRFLSR
ncbi:MAG: glutamine-hydrolyzing GMP synthase, partial [bacterium]